MEAILSTIDRHREALRGCRLYRYLADQSIESRQRMAFAPHVAYFSMSFGDLMSTVLRRENPQTDLERYVNAHCAEDDHHWEWFLEDIKALGSNEMDFVTACRHLWSSETTPVRHLIYSVVGHASRSDDPLLHLILIEILEAGLSGFFEHCYKDVARDDLRFLKYFGETHYNAEYEHTLTSWFQIDDMDAANRRHPLEGYTPSPEVRNHADAAIEDLFAHFHSMYDCWYEVAQSRESALTV